MDVATAIPNNPFDLIVKGGAKTDETLWKRINNRKLEREQAHTALDRARAQAGSHLTIDPAKVTASARLMRETFASSYPGA